MNYDDMDALIGTVLKSYRKFKKLTIRQVGEMLDVNNSTVSRWETGENAISAKLLLHYLDILYCPYERFISDLRKAERGEEICQ